MTYKTSYWANGEQHERDCTPDEIADIAARNATPVPPAQQIAALETSITARRLREAVLTESGALWLAGVDAQIAALRAQL